MFKVSFLRLRFVVTAVRHRVDTLRKCIYALDAQSVLVFMNYGRRLQVSGLLTLMLSSSNNWRGPSSSASA